MLRVLAVFATAALAATNLTVYTRTGVFRGDLNDTYADVRQFKWVPYAKVNIMLDQLPDSFPDVQ